jgi:predicted TIM-barrel fold metal-dependent hydrolase
VDKTAASDRDVYLASVDDHLVEPPSLWVDRLSHRDPEAIPHVVRELVSTDLKDGTEKAWCDVWCYEDVRVPTQRFSAYLGTGHGVADIAPMTFDEMRPGCFQVAERLADMDIDGVRSSLCFPNLFVRFCGQRFLEAKDKDVALKCVRAYNDFLYEEWAGPSGGRLQGAGLIPLWDAEESAREVHRNAERGFRAVCFSEVPVRLGLPSMYSGFWEPFFSACNDTGTVINVHIGSSSQVPNTSEDAPHGLHTANFYTNSSLSLSDWLLCGAFLRYPDLKVAFSEGQAGWIPYLLSRLDGLWHAGHVLSEIRSSLPEPPSSYMRDHVYACVFDDPTAMRLLDQIGVDNVCFETDYPHADGLWPHSRRVAENLVAGLDADVREKILFKNAQALFGFAGH